MAKDAYETAIQKKNIINQELIALEEQAKVLRDELKILDSFIKTWHDLTGQKEPPHNAEKAQKRKIPATRRGPRVNIPLKELATIVRDILSHSTKAMSRRELFQAIQSMGIEIKGKDPEMVFSTMMWRMGEQFVRLPPPHGYWLVDRPYPPANYIPPQS